MSNKNLLKKTFFKKPVIFQFIHETYIYYIDVYIYERFRGKGDIQLKMRVAGKIFGNTCLKAIKDTFFQ